MRLVVGRDSPFSLPGVLSEAFSEVLLGANPSVRSEMVMDYIADQVNESFKYRRIIGL